MNGDEAAKAQADYAPLAASACCEGLPVRCVGGCCDVPTVAETVLDEAARITSSDRNQTYGPPRDNHSRTAAMVWAYIQGITGRDMDYRDICWINVLQKASRDVFHRQRDNLTDGCGFLRNVEMADNDEGRA